MKNDKKNRRNTMTQDYDYNQIDDKNDDNSKNDDNNGNKINYCG